MIKSFNSILLSGLLELQNAPLTYSVLLCTLPPELQCGKMYFGFAIKKSIYKIVFFQNCILNWLCAIRLELFCPSQTQTKCMISFRVPLCRVKGGKILEVFFNLSSRNNQITKELFTNHYTTRQKTALIFLPL